MALLIEKGMTLRNRSEPGWPTITVQSIHAEPTATFAGRTIQPFAYVTWSDNPHVNTAHSLADLVKNWESVDA